MNRVSECVSPLCEWLKQPYSGLDVRTLDDRGSGEHVKDRCLRATWQVLTSGGQVSGRLNTLARELVARPNTNVSQTLLQDFTQLMLCFSNLRARFVAETV